MRRYNDLLSKGMKNKNLNPNPPKNVKSHIKPKKEPSPKRTLLVS